ncbi:ArsR/SmtB family transcription factor [Azospirillum sp.]|uniref:ArsR/SmtB family transcription factor n=1 Tax=Azospirillum sp. TaxID=34012 RepID=UPI003D71432E
MNELEGRHIRSAARLLKALANERRLAILCHLGRGEMRVGVLADAVGLSQSALSQHLAKLRADGLVRTRREGQTIVYALASADVSAVIGVLAELYCGTPPGSSSSNQPTHRETTP